MSFEFNILNRKGENTMYVFQCVNTHCNHVMVMEDRDYKLQCPKCDDYMALRGTKPFEYEDVMVAHGKGTT